MHRMYLGLSLSILAVAVVLTGCGQSDKPIAALAQNPPGDTTPVRPGEAKPGGPIDPTDPTNPPPVDPSTDLTDPTAPPLSDTKTDQDTLPVLPTLTAPTGTEKYESALSRAFVLIAEKKNKEALTALEEALAAQETDFVKSEIERIKEKINRSEAAEKAANDIKEVLDAGQAEQAAKLAGEALEQYGDSEVAEKLTALKRQADALASTSLEEKARQRRFLTEAETARRTNNYRTAVLAYDQAVGAGADVGELRETYESLKVRVAKYDENRTKAAELRKDPYQLEDAIEALKVSAENWDTPQVRQEISEAELAINNRKERVAIADFEEVNDIGVPRAGHVIAEEMLGHLRPRFDVVERQQTEALLREMKMNHVALYEDDAGRGEFGRLARARYVVLGSVSRLGGIHANARLVDTKTGLVVQTARVVAASPEELSNRLPALGRMLQMNDDEKRAFEREQAEKARPVEPAAPRAETPPPPPAAAQATEPPPPPIVVYSPRPPVYGAVAVADFDGFRVVTVGAPPPPPVVVVDAPILVRDRAFAVAIDLGDNCYRRGHYRDALRHFEFALSLRPGHGGCRWRIDICRPLCPPPVVVMPILRPRMVVLPFAEFRDPFSPFSSIPPGLGVWTSNAIAPYFSNRYDIVGDGELYWWMGRLGLNIRDVLTNPHARLCLGRALGARFFLMGALREVASFDASTHIIDAELNQQVFGARVRVQNAAELRYRLPELATLTYVPAPQQVVIVQQQQVVQQRVVAAQVEFRKGNFRIALGFYKEVLAVQPTHVEARQMLVQIEFRNRQAELEAARQAAWQQQQAAMRADRDRQIALAAASEAARLQARRDRVGMGGAQQQLLVQQQLLAQQNLLAQAQLAQRQNNLEQRVALLESANGIRRDDKVVDELARARAQLAVEKQKRLAAEQAAREAEARRKRDIELERTKAQLALEQQKRQLEEEARRKAAEAKAQAEYDQFVDAGQRAMAAQRYAVAVGAFQNARRIKPSPEIEKLVSSALVEQARAEAEKKGAEEKKKLEAQLAQEEARRKQLEEQNAKLRTKYQAALAQARSAMQAKKYDEAVTSYKIATTTMQTDEATAELKTAQTELARANSAAAAEAKKKNEEAQRAQALLKHQKEGRAALAAKQFDKAVTAFQAAATLVPADAEVQSELTRAKLARDDAALAARKAKEEQLAEAQALKLVAAGNQNLKAKQYDAAIVAFGDALKLDADNKAAKTGLEQAQTAQAAMLKDTTAQAEAKKKRDEYDRLMKQGRAALGLKQYSDALGLFQKAQTLLPGDAASTQLIADVQKQMAQTEATELARRKAAEVAQVIATGRAALKAGKIDEAQTSADKALTLAPTNLDAKRLVTEIDTARKAMTAAKKEPVVPKKGIAGTLAQARQAIKAQDFDKAATLLAAARAEEPTAPEIAAVQTELNNARAAMSTAEAEAKKRQLAYDNAIKAAREALEDKKFTVAIQQATEALRLKPADPVASQLLAAARKSETAAAMDAQKMQQAYLTALRDASTAMAAKKYDVAIAEAKEALAAKPGDPAATKILADAQKAKEAAGMATMEAEKKNAAYDAAMKTGRAALAAKDYDDAAKAFGMALAAIPNDPTATALLKQAKDGESAMAAETERKKLYDAWFQRGQQLVALKRFPEAIEAFQNCLKVRPGDAVATQALKEAQAASMPKKEPVPVPKKEPDPMPLPKKEPLPLPKKEPEPMPLPKKEPLPLPKKEPAPMPMPMPLPKKEPVPVPKKELPKVDPVAGKVAELMKSADAQEDAGKYAEALQTYQEVQRLAPANAEAKRRALFCFHMDSGKKDLAAGKLADAATDFEQAVKLDPTNADAKKLLAQARAKKK